MYIIFIRGPGWRIHGGVEDTKLSTNKQHTLSSTLFPESFFIVSTTMIKLPPPFCERVSAAISNDSAGISMHRSRDQGIHSQRCLGRATYDTRTCLGFRV